MNTTTRKTLKDLTIRDNFLFAAVMQQEDNCKRFLEILLGIEIAAVEVDYERSIIYSPEFKSIRLDVYARDDANTRYNIEIQLLPDELPRRSRYYHSQLDMELLKSGEDYGNLPDCYVIFICNFVPFDRKRFCYTYQNVCLEEPQLMLRDGRKTIFLSTKGTVS